MKRMGKVGGIHGVFVDLIVAKNGFNFGKWTCFDVPGNATFFVKTYHSEGCGFSDRHFIFLFQLFVSTIE